MIQKMLDAGANTNGIDEFQIPIFMIPLGSQKMIVERQWFNHDIAELLLEFPKTDLTSQFYWESCNSTILDISLQNKIPKKAGELVTDVIRRRFASRLVGVEKEVFETIRQFSAALCTVVSEYSCCDGQDKFLEYTVCESGPGPTSDVSHNPSLTFLFNIFEEPRFKEIAREQRNALKASDKPSAA